MKIILLLLSKDSLKLRVAKLQLRGARNGRNGLPFWNISDFSLVEPEILPRLPLKNNLTQKKVRCLESCKHTHRENPTSMIG